MLAVQSHVIERLYGNIRGWGWGVCACMCVYACVKCFRGECGRVVGKLSHHLFIQSTEEGVSGEGGGAAFCTPPGEYCRSRVVFLATSAILCLKA